MNIKIVLSTTYTFNRCFRSVTFLTFFATSCWRMCSLRERLVAIEILLNSVSIALLSTRIFHTVVVCTNDGTVLKI